MTTRQTLLALVAAALLSGCAAPRIMKPETAALGNDASAKRCVGDDVCFVYRKE